MRHAVLRTISLLALTTTSLPAAAAAAAAGGPGARGTRQQLFDAWLASDAVVVAAYHGVDSTLGPRYRRAVVENVWVGTPERGDLVFKAPRGIRARPGERALLFLWDRLAGAPDAYLEESKARYGDAVWQTVGPDSHSVYLLPYAAYAYRLDGDKLTLQGHRAAPAHEPLDAVEQEVLGWEAEHSPARLFSRSAVAVRGRIETVEIVPRTQQGIVIERRVHLTLRSQQVLKGEAPDPLKLEFISFPRAPRFRQGDEAIVFLSRGPTGLYFEFGKRGAFHVVDGEVLEAGRPVAEFVKSLQAQR